MRGVFRSEGVDLIDCGYKSQHLTPFADGKTSLFHLHAVLQTYRTAYLEVREAVDLGSVQQQADFRRPEIFQIARAVGLENRMKMEQAGLTIRKWRKELGLVPIVNQIDTLAAEYPAQTNYLYLSYL